MKLEVDPHGHVVLKEVYTGIELVSDSGETFAICMRDGGFEFKYGGTWWNAQAGQVDQVAQPAPLDLSFADAYALQDSAMSPEQ